MGGKTVTITATAKDGSGKKASYKIYVKKGIVINQASQVNMENIKVEDPEAPGIQIKNATGIIINGKEYKKDSGKMLLSGNQRN